MRVAEWMGWGAARAESWYLQGMGQETVCLLRPHDAVHADSLCTFLQAQGVDAVVVSFQDTAYPRVVDRERPWGELRVPAKDEVRARELIEAWDKGEVVPPDDTSPAPKPDTKSVRGPSALILVAVSLLGLWWLATSLPECT